MAQGNPKSIRMLHHILLKFLYRRHRITMTDLHGLDCKSACLLPTLVGFVCVCPGQITSHERKATCKRDWFVCSCAHQGPLNSASRPASSHRRDRVTTARINVRPTYRVDFVSLCFVQPIFDRVRPRPSYRRTSHRKRTVAASCQCTTPLPICAQPRQRCGTCCTG
jgi:hypothetical protein